MENVEIVDLTSLNEPAAPKEEIGRVVMIQSLSVLRLYRDI